MYFKFINDFDIVLQPYGSFISSRMVSNFHVLNKASTKIILELIAGYSFETISIGCSKQFYDILDMLKRYRYGYEVKSSSLSDFTIDSTDELLKIVRAEIEYTNQCNLKCKYCYAQSNTFKEELPLSKWIEILDNMHDKGLRAILISGGEPFYRKDLLKLVKYFSNKFIIEINTNGTFITNNIAKELSYFKLKRVQISLDSFTHNYHDSLRGKGTHKLAMNAIQILSKYGIPIQISSVATKTNYSEIQKIRSFAKSINAEFFVNNIIKAGTAENINDKEWKTKYELDTKNAPSIENNEITFNPICQSQIGYIAISYNGTLKPCNMREAFFESTRNRLLIDYKQKWWNNYYHELSIGQSVANLKQPTKKDINKFLGNSKNKICNLQINITSNNNMITKPTSE